MNKLAGQAIAALGEPYRTLAHIRTQCVGACTAAAPIHTVLCGFALIYVGAASRVGHQETRWAHARENPGRVVGMRCAAKCATSSRANAARIQVVAG